MGLIFFLLIDSGFLFHGRSHGLKANKKKQTRSDLAAMLLPRLELFLGGKMVGRRFVCCCFCVSVVRLCAEVQRPPKLLALMRMMG